MIDGGDWLWSPNGIDQTMYITFSFDRDATPMLECDFYTIDKSSSMETEDVVKDVNVDSTFGCSWSAEEATQQIKVDVSCAAGAGNCDATMWKVWDKTAATAGLVFVHQDWLSVDPMNSVE